MSLALLCLAGLGLPARASAAEPDPDLGSIGIQLLEGPADRREDPRARRYIVDHLPPGTVVKRQMLVANKTDKRQEIELYPAAATVADARFQFGEGRTPNELSSWISLDRKKVELEPGDEARFRATITVPPAAPKGERYAVIWASIASEANPDANVNKIHRVGVRTYLDIGIGGEPPSSFEIGDLVPARDTLGVPSVRIAVKNTGERALDLTGSVTLSDGPAGMQAGPFDVVEGTTLAPGESGTVLATLPAEIPNGPWQIDVNLESGQVKESLSARITFPDPGRVGKPSSPLSRFDSPWVLAAASLVGLILIAVLVLLIRRRSRRHRYDMSA
ncbi:hypothetical protein [Micromonospora sp. NBC_01796]|uniref:hypothetical protein n=1 Tax=Micromonospora sp. NBC_01796 TaxID=2975987 RepID=UPI002DD7A59B|nr:hypothetical protein [Micromonospora sp. NBC_01796]WSA88906.1 DUF916 domain-containing protein [Micromonospora sp. NBC_01796]